MSKRRRPPKRVETITHDEASRKNIPTAKHQPVMFEGDRTPIQVAYERRNADLDPQLVWRGKDMQDWSDLVVPDLARAAREAAEAGFDLLIACAFNFGPHTTDFNKLGRIRVLKPRINADLHMADDLKNTGKGNLFVIFGEPDIDIIRVGDDGSEDDRVQVKIRGVDVFHPGSGEIRSDDTDGIACWFIDTDYSEESFFVRHAYFLGASDPYKSLKTSLKAEINPDAWATLHSDTSRPFHRPETGRIAVKVINHLGDEVMKVFRA